jgi:hypothetical protein
MKMNRIVGMAGIAAIVCFTAMSGLAQQNQGGQGQGGGRGGRGGGGFDPAQFRERMMERTKENLEIKDDAEWKAIEPLVQKVMDARMASFGGMGRGMMGRRPGGDRGGDQGNRPAGGGIFGQANPEADALQRAIDGKASASELKAAVAKYNEARKAKQAELEKAQAELRKVLTVRQEALATLNGLL